MSVTPSACLGAAVTMTRVSKLSMAKSRRPAGMSFSRHCRSLMANTLFLTFSVWARLWITVGIRLVLRIVLNESEGKIHSPLPLMLSSRPL